MCAFMCNLSLPVICINIHSLLSNKSTRLVRNTIALFLHMYYNIYIPILYIYIGFKIFC